MPNRKVMESAAEMRRARRPQAERTYRKYGAQARELIRQLGSHSQEAHDRAYDLLRRMGDFIVDELLEALHDLSLSPVAIDEVVSLLGATGDERAREPIWQFLQSNLDNPERVSTAALSLAGLGDDRALPFLRAGLESQDEEQVANGVAGLIMVGRLEDIPRLRQVHRAHRANREICFGVANAILTILGETNERTFNRTLDEIRTSFADRHLWADIWAILESEFGSSARSVH
ncbi:MAG: HEAT repeat domain-containing protein [Anaerolineae bacterium]|nr:HEAT repeat domain-containing protein [Anaerolineae bacterium]